MIGLGPRLTLSCGKATVAEAIANQENRLGKGKSIMFAETFNTYVLWKCIPGSYNLYCTEYSFL